MSALAPSSTALPSAPAARRTPADEAPVSRRYGLNTGAVVYIVIAVFLAIGAVNSQNNLLYIAFGVALSAMIVSGFISGSALVGISLRRDPLPPARAGEPIPFRYTIENRRRLPAFGLIVSERIAGEPKPVVTASVIMLGPKRAARVTGRASFERRGPREAEAVLISSTFPFGLLRKTIVVAQREEVLVGPRRATLRRGALPTPRGAGRDTRQREAPVSGVDEFVGLREYMSGDSPRRIAWKPSARLDTLVVRQTNSATPPSVRISIEPHDPDEPWRFERSLVLAAAAAEQAASRGAMVGLSIPQSGISIPPTPDVSASGALMRALARASIDPVPDAETAGRGSVGHTGRRATLVTVGPSPEATLCERRFEEIVELRSGSDRAPGSDLDPLAPNRPRRWGGRRSRAGRGASR